MAETMYSEIYQTMHEQIELKALTEPEAKKMISNLYMKKMFTEEEFNLLMKEADSLSVNSDYGEINNQITELRERVSKLESRMQNAEDAIKEGSTEIPEPEPGASGSSEDPIVAYAGMTYYKDKYYKDPLDNQIYQCFRDSDSEPGTGVRLDFVPSQLVNIYFHFVRVS